MEQRPPNPSSPPPRPGRSWVSALAEWAYQRPGEVEASEGRGRLFLAYGAVAVLLGGLLAMGVVGFRNELTLWGEGKPLFPFPKSEWRVLLTEERVGKDRAADLCGRGAIGPRCPGHPSNVALWSSSLRRSDPDHRERLRKAQGKVYWVGTIVPRGTLQKAQSQNANGFLIGKVMGTHRVYFDGRHVASGDVEHSRTSLFVPLSAEQMQGKRDLALAIEIEHDQGHMLPDIMNAAFGGEGLVGTAELDGHLRRRQFMVNTLQFSTSLVQMTIALLFFFIWMSARWKRENLIVSLYAFVNACIQARQVDSIYLTLGPSIYYNIDVGLRIAEALVGMSLGLSFSRTRNDVRWVLVGALGIFAVFGWARAIQDTPTLLLYSGALGRWLVPTAFSISIGSILLQAFHLQMAKGSATFVPTRVKRLLSLVAIQAAVMGLYIYQARHVTTDDQLVLVYRFAYLALTLVLGAVVLSEYREREKILQESPVSKWFLRGALPESVPGVLLKFDLKGSEQMESEYSARGYGGLTEIWYRYCSKIVGEQRGEVLSEEGDCILAYFDHEFPDAEKRALLAIEEIHRMHAHLQPALGLKHPILFRGSLVAGKLQPTWKGEGRQKKAGYSGDVLKDAERILKIETKLDPGRTKSLLLIEEGVGLRLSLGEAELLAEEDSGGTIRRFYKKTMGPILLGQAPSKILRRVA